MWKLAIEDDQGNRTVVNLVRDEYSIGRAEENTVRLTERNISRQHAKLAKNGSGWTLSDMSSYNGCFLNGARINGSHKVEHGDLVQLGDYRLEVVDEGLRTGANSPVATVPVLPKSQSLVGQPDRLVMLVGPAPGAEFPLVGSRLVVGRGEECDLPLNHSSVSRVHAEVHAIGDGRYEIIDRESANGVRVNGVELKRSLIDARDTIELGDVVLKFIPAGEIYRPDLEDAQQVASARHRSDRPSPAPGVEAQSSSGGMSSGLKIVAALLGLGALVLLGMITLRSTHSSPPPQEPPAAPVDGTAKVLEEAKGMLDRGDVEGAHDKVTRELPPESNARQSPEFREIEARWADSLFTQAADEMDSIRKRALYDRIAKSASVDSDRRQRAVNEIAVLDVDRVDVSDLPSAPSATAPAQSKPPRQKPAAATPKEPSSSPASDFRENPYAEPGEPETSSAKVQNAEDLATSGDRQKVARAKAILQGKVNSGRATEQEMRMLKALCRQLGDTSCSQ